MIFSTRIPYLPAPAVLHIGQQETIRRIETAIVNASAGVITLSLTEPVISGTPVQLEVSGGRVTGEMTLCLGEGSAFTGYVGIGEVEATGGDIANLINALLREGPSVAPSTAEVLAGDALEEEAVPVYVRPRNVN